LIVLKSIYVFDMGKVKHMLGHFFEIVRSLCSLW